MTLQTRLIYTTNAGVSYGRWQNADEAIEKTQDGSLERLGAEAEVAGRLFHSPNPVTIAWSGDGVVRYLNGNAIAWIEIEHRNE